MPRAKNKIKKLYNVACRNTGLEFAKQVSNTIRFSPPPMKGNLFLTGKCTALYSDVQRSTRCTLDGTANGGESTGRDKRLEATAGLLGHPAIFASQKLFECDGH